MTKSLKLKRNLAVSLNNQWDSNWLKNFSLRKYTHNNKLQHLSSKRMWQKTTSSTITQLMTISHLYRFLSKVSKTIRSKWQTSSFKSKESAKLPSFKLMSESLCNKVKKTNRSNLQLKKKPKPSITYECAIFWTRTETMQVLQTWFDRRWF